MAESSATNLRQDFEPPTQNRSTQEEGRVAKAIERQTTKIPSDVFLWAATGSMTASFVLQLLGAKERSLFIGQWAPTFLILGLYNKLVKIEGSDRYESL